MNRKKQEQLLDKIGEVDERYILEYLDAQTTKSENRRPRRAKLRLSLVLAATLVILLGSVSLAAIPIIGHFLSHRANEIRVIMQNFDEIESQYAVHIGDTQECDDVIATLNSAVVEDRYLLLSYTFDWSGLEEARDGSFHTYFLPWFFYITEGDTVLCQSEYTKGLHTQIYSDDASNDTAMTLLYCIDLEQVDGRDLVGKELTVSLLYSNGGEGFTSTFTPVSCFTGRSWDINESYEFGEHTITVNRVQESALYVTLFIDCATIGHTGDEYSFILSDELGNDYTVYLYEDNDVNGYWYTKPDTMGTQLILKVIRSNMKSSPYGEILDDSYEVLYEIPIKLESEAAR